MKNIDGTVSVDEKEGKETVENPGASATCFNDAVLILESQESGSGDKNKDVAVLKKSEKLESDEKMNNSNGNNYCCLRIEVIDETALVETPEHGGKKEKRPRRRGKNEKTNNNTGAIEKQKLVDLGFSPNDDEKKEWDDDKRVYSRKELEALRYVGVELQKKKWTEVYCGLGPVVQKEYDELVGSSKEKKQKEKHIRVNFNPPFRNEGHSSVLGEESSQHADSEIAYENPMDPTSGLLLVNDQNGCLIEQEECMEDDSDEDYSSIQKPAFFVTGEPDFDSGPAEDGLEYLRRVRWEAAQMPKVKVAKVDRSKLNKEQTVYMPQIPDLAKCPVHLMPLKEWEDAFLADFSELRLALSRFENLESKVDLYSAVCNEEPSSKVFESTLLENFDNMPVVEDSCESMHYSLPETCGDSCFLAVANDNDCLDSTESPSSRLYGTGISGKCPALFLILKMDSVSRVSMLRKRISVAESISNLSWDDCLWLFALSAAVDCPLDADTAAAFRSLLRKCASLRAEKLELDDEVVMLNILTTISGRYFGQLEN